MKDFVKNGKHFACGIIMSLCISCATPSPVPPPPFIVIRTFYKTAAGADLLNRGTPNSFKEDEILVISQLEVHGIVTEINYDTIAYGGVVVDGETGFNCLQLAIPTNWAKNPIKTLIRLNQNDTDTVTYTWQPSKYAYTPDKIFYNNNIVWTVNEIPRNQQYQPITIIK